MSEIPGQLSIPTEAGVAYRRRQRSKRNLYNNTLNERKNREAALSRLKDGCLDCKESDWRVLEFDHRPGEIKRFTISSQNMRRSCGTFSAELAKCDVVCSNCHTKRGHERGDLTSRWREF